ncbi:hypothetical protein BH10PAT4_BH10PAT4_2430 [soil metagenome]
MEHEDGPKSNEYNAVVAQATEICKLASTIILSAARLKVYTEYPHGNLFQIIDDIGIRAVRDERSELVELITLLLDFNEHRDNLIKPDLRIVVTVIQNGVMTINLEF